MAANKVVFGNKVLIDLTGDTVTEEALLKGYTAHKACLLYTSDAADE